MPSRHSSSGIWRRAGNERALSASLGCVSTGDDQVTEGAGARPRGLRAALRHAFAVEPDGIAEPTAEERALLDPVIAEVRRRGLAGPAALFLESAAPLNGVGAQALHFLQPFATAVLDPVRYAALARYLERRGSVAWMVRELGREER